MRTVTYNDVELQVEYDFQPYEPQTRNYPGCPASVQVSSVKVADVDISELLTDDQFEEIAEIILNEIHDV